MNVYFQELKMSLRSAVYWTLGMIMMLLFFMLMFPAISKDAEVMQQMINNFPPEFIKALGLSTLDLSTVTGYYGFLFTYILLIGSLYAMKAGVSVLSEEIRVKTADFLISKPVTRFTIVSAKFASALTFLLLQNILYITSLFLIVHLITEQSFDRGIFMLINLSLLLIQLFFMTLGLFLSVVIRKIKTVLPITLGVVFGFFILQLLNQSLNDAKLAYVTPFAYFDISHIIGNGGYEAIFVVMDCGLITAFSILTYVFYNKRDMPSV